MAEIKWIKKYEKKVRVIPSPPKPQTNADRIRAMTDEELAEFLSHPRSVCPKFDCNKCEEDDCHACMLECLKKEVDE